MKQHWSKLWWFTHSLLVLFSDAQLFLFYSAYLPPCIIISFFDFCLVFCSGRTLGTHSVGTTAGVPCK
jgi:hypothetical protein